MSKQEPRQEFKITGVEDGRVRKANVAGIVDGGMGNRNRNTHNQGDRSITNQGNIGNIATGDNHSGSMSASVGGPTVGTKDPKRFTPAELINILKEHHCTDDTLEKFEKNKVDGRLFMELDDEILDELEINNKIERRKLRKLKQELMM